MKPSKQQIRWLSTPLARALFASECTLLKRALPKFQGHFCLHLQPWENEAVYRPVKLSQHVMIMESVEGVYQGADRTSLMGPVKPGLAQASNTSALVTDFSALPFRDNSVDVVFLHHCLEFHSAPHSVLREASRVLLPNGALIVLAFNPYSMWGVRRLLYSWSSTDPLGWAPISQGRVEDWLALLDYRVEMKAKCMYRWPVQWRQALDWLAPMEALSRLAWMPGGGVHVTMARKQVGGLTPLRPKWRLPRPANSLIPSAPRLPKHIERKMPAKAQDGSNLS